MSTHVTIELPGKIDDDIVNEIQGYNGQVAFEKFLSGTEILTIILLPVVSVGIEKTLSLIVDKIMDKASGAKDKFTIRYNGKEYKNLDIKTTKQLIKSIDAGKME